MKAIAVYPNQRRLAAADLPEPHLSSDDQVLVRILEVGLCGTDQEIANFEYGSPPAGSDFLVIGHEALGEVVEVGPAVEDVRPGDLVVPTVRRPCGDPICPACAVGRQDFCFTGKYRERGIKGLHGFLTGLITEEARYLHRVPRELREAGVLVEPLTVAAKALRQIQEVQDRLPWSCTASPALTPETRQEFSCRRALVLGAGPVGLLGAMTLAAAGFQTSVYSRLSGISERLRIPQAIGCAFIAAEEHPADEFAAQLEKVDVIYEAVGASELAFQMLELLGPNGVFVFTGVPGSKNRAAINTDKIMRNLVLKNQVLLGTVNAAPEDFDRAIRLLGEFQAKWPGVPARLKTHALEPGQVSDALQHGTGIKQYVRFSEPSAFQQ